MPEGIATTEEVREFAGRRERIEAVRRPSTRP